MWKCWQQRCLFHMLIMYLFRVCRWTMCTSHVNFSFHVKSKCSKWICAFNLRDFFFLLKQSCTRFLCTTCIWKSFVGNKFKRKVLLSSQKRTFQQSKAIVPLMRKLNETNDTTRKKTQHHTQGMHRHTIAYAIFPICQSQ